MKLTELFQMGGLSYMNIISIWGIAMLAFTVKKMINFFVQHNYSKDGLRLILLFGSLAIATGFLVQAIGLFQIFGLIEAISDVEPSIIMGGIRVTMVPPIYGTIIFILSLISWGILREKYQKNHKDI